MPFFCTYIHAASMLCAALMGVSGFREKYEHVQLVNEAFVPCVADSSLSLLKTIENSTVAASR